MNTCTEYAERNELALVTVAPEIDSAGADSEPEDDPPTPLMPFAADDAENMTLEELASEIRKVHVSRSRASAMVCTYAITAGRLLANAKKRIPAGSWEEWVQLNCEFSPRTARDYMRIAKTYGGGDKRQHAAAFESLREALAEIQENETKGEARKKTAAAEAETDEWNDCPAKLARELAIWSKTGRRFLTLTRRLSDVSLRSADPTLKARFQDLLRSTIADVNSVLHQAN